MPFDLNPKEVEKIRNRFESNPDPSYVVSVASDIQDNYLPKDSAVIGGITTLDGIQSTRTRRPLSASADFIIKGDDISGLGGDFPSWKYGSAYFADVKGVEIGVLDIEEFDPFNFPESSITESYPEKYDGNSINVAKPEPNITSKFNRICFNPEKSKQSDLIDFNSHVHWYTSKDYDLRNLADLVRRRVKQPYSSAFRKLRGSDENFNEEEWGTIRSALDNMESELEE